MKHAKVKILDQPCHGMKTCTMPDAVKHDGDYHVVDFIFIENDADLEAYENTLYGAVQNEIVKCMNSPLFPKHVDHMLGGRDMGTQLLAVAYYKAAAHGLQYPDQRSIFNNPLYQIENAAHQKVGILRKILRQGNSPLINPAGGFMLLMPGRHELVEVYDRKPDSGAPKDVLRTDAKVVVLENDWDLPKESKEYLNKTYGKNWASQGNYSIVYDLRGHSKSDLTNFLRKFKAGGGDTVFVHTTGLDVPQMFEYAEAMIDAGLEKLVLHITGGTTDKHDEFFKKFRQTMNITVLESL